MDDYKDKKKRAVTTTPQLARPCYNVDSSSEDEGIRNDIPSKFQSVHNPLTSKDYDDDDQSLEIMPPIKTELKTSFYAMKKEKDIMNNRMGTSAVVFKESKPEVKPNISPQKSAVDSKLGIKMTLSLPCAFSSSSDDDDDDDIVLAKPTFESQEQIRDRKKRLREEQKEREKLAKARKRQQEKAAKEQQKERDKQAKARKRQEEKVMKEQQKEREKAAKRRDNEVYSQVAGKFKHEEIAVLLDPKLYHEGFVKMLAEDFLVHSYPSNLTMAPAAIQFVRKEYLHGGAKDAVQKLVAKDTNGYQHLQHLVLVVEPNDFIPLLRRQEKNEDDDYPKLESWLNCTRTEWQRVWGTPSTVSPRIMLLFCKLPETLDKMWVEHRRRSSESDTSLPTAWELQDAIQWLLVQFQVECILCPNDEAIQLTVQKLTRALSDKPYKTQVTELECIRKIKQAHYLSENPVDRARDVWARQLQSIPRISESMAMNVVERYPTCQSLWQAYHHCERGENESPQMLLGDILNGGKSSQQKLSAAVYRILTSNDPEEMVL